MESKLLVGGKTILDKTTEQEKALEQRRKEILEQKVFRFRPSFEISISLHFFLT